MYTHEELIPKLYFNDVVGEEEKAEIRDLFFKVCDAISSKSSAHLTQIYGGLDFIIYKRIEDSLNHVEGGLAGKSSQRCFVIFYLPQSFHEETKLYILAHEFAHVYFYHPANNPLPTKEEQKVSEFQADLMATEEWGFKPDVEDVEKLDHYIRFLKLRSIYQERLRDIPDLLNLLQDILAYLKAGHENSENVKVIIDSANRLQDVLEYLQPKHNFTGNGLQNILNSLNLLQDILECY